MGIDPLLAKNPKEVSSDELSRNKKRFLKEFQDYDWTEASNQ